MKKIIRQTNKHYSCWHQPVDTSFYRTSNQVQWYLKQQHKSSEKFWMNMIENYAAIMETKIIDQHYSKLPYLIPSMELNWKGRTVLHAGHIQEAIVLIISVFSTLFKLCNMLGSEIYIEKLRKATHTASVYKFRGTNVARTNIAWTNVT